MILNNVRALRAAITYCIPRIAIMRDDALGDSGHFLVGDEVYESCCNMLRELKSALDSAPARNCDRFKTKEEAAIAFANEKKQWIPQQVLWELAPWLDWLFTATKEGENNENY